MIFFYSYLSPLHHNNLCRNFFYSFNSVYSLTESEQLLIDYCDDYSHSTISNLDIAYQVVSKGFIFPIPNQIEESNNIHPTVVDSYRFLKRFFHPAWSWYVLIIRLLSFHNPFREIHAHWAVRKVRRLDLYRRIYDWESGYYSFTSTLLASSPLVTVVLPTLNRYSYLAYILGDLEKQDYKNFEVVVVDQSYPFRPEFYHSFTASYSLRVIHQPEKGLWRARNRAICEGKGEYIAFTEDDVRVPSNWITQHLKCLDFFQADISTGVFFPQGSSIPESRRFFRMADQFSSGNSMVQKAVFQKTGLFDLQFEGQRMGDGEFGLRAQLAGIRSISNPLAYCEDVKAPVGGLRQMGSWDAFRPRNFFAPRPIPSVLYLARRYFGTRAAILAIIRDVPPSILPYRFKRHRITRVVAFFLVILLGPLVMVSVWRSWRRASQMLHEGSKIPSLESAPR